MLYGAKETCLHRCSPGIIESGCHPCCKPLQAEHMLLMLRCNGAAADVLAANQGWSAPECRRHQSTCGVSREPGKEDLHSHVFCNAPSNILKFQERTVCQQSRAMC